MNRLPIVRVFLFCVLIAAGVTAGETPTTQPLSSIIEQFKLRYGFDPSTLNSTQAPANNPDDIYWNNEISPVLQGVDGTIFCAVVYHGSLVVGGKFAVAGGAIANNIAVWDGYAWSALGNGFNQEVKVLAVYGNNLVASGEFTASGSTPISHIASWNGSTWSALGTGLDRSASAMAEFNGKLYVGGKFTTVGFVNANGIAAWNGTSWSSLGSGVVSDWAPGTEVSSLTVFDNKLIAGGSFYSAGNVSAKNVAAWNGSSWSAIGLGLTGPVSALTVYDSALIASGSFDTADGAWAYNIAGWNGQSWSIIGDGTSLVPTSLASYDGDLFAGGGNLGILRWNGNSWATVSGPEIATINALVVYNNQLIGAVAETYSRLVAWNGSSWVPMAATDILPYYAGITCYTTYNDKLVAGGNFTTIGGISAPYIAQWDGNAWSPLGSGMNSPVYSLAIYNNKLIAGGGFTSAGGIAAKHVAAWDGNDWSSLGSGSGDTAAIPFGAALAVYGDNLVIGGAPDGPSGNGSNYLALWNGSNWKSFGALTYMEDYGYASIFALATYNNKLVVGGSFLSIDGIGALNIATWNGSSWAPIDNNQLPVVQSLTVFNGQLIAGHTFGVSRLYGSTWSRMGTMSKSGWLPQVLSVGTYNNFLIVGGMFDTVNGVSANSICVWDGTTWSALGSGIGGADPAVFALTEFQNSLVAGGAFTAAGSKTSAYAAVWHKVPADVNDGGSRTLPNSFALEQNYPNPFNPSTHIQFTLPVRSHVSIEIFNLLGQSVRNLVDQSRPAGTYTVDWDGKDDAGNSLATGVYLYKLQTDDYQETRKMVLLK